MKGDDEHVRPISGVAFDLTCTGADAFSSRLCTDGDGKATTYARPGKCLLKSRSPMRRGGKSFTWSGNVEFFPAKETRLDLTEENAVVQADEGPPSVPDEPNSAPAPVCGGDAQLPTADVRLPVLVHKVEPEYPPEEILRLPRLEVKVICQAVIDTDGHVKNVKVLSTSNPRFNASAIRAILRRRYIPAQSHGQPYAIYFTIRIDYR
jgi:TonB family protein